MFELSAAEVFMMLASCCCSGLVFAGISSWSWLSYARACCRSRQCCALLFIDQNHFIFISNPKTQSGKNGASVSGLINQPQSSAEDDNRLQVLVTNHLRTFYRPIISMSQAFYKISGMFLAQGWSVWPRRTNLILGTAAIFTGTFTSARTVWFSRTIQEKKRLHQQHKILKNLLINEWLAACWWFMWLSSERGQRLQHRMSYSVGWSTYLYSDDSRSSLF